MRPSKGRGPAIGADTSDTLSVMSISRTENTNSSFAGINERFFDGDHITNRRTKTLLDLPIKRAIELINRRQLDITLNLNQ